MSNQEFLNANAKSGSVVLAGGTSLIDKTIRSAQKKIHPESRSALFSHAFLISEKRSDDHWWIIESDLEFHRKQMKLGVQENRLEKYYDDSLFPNLAVLDFDLTEAQRKSVLSEALSLVAGRANYSIREIMGVLLSFANNKRGLENRFAQNNSFICSAFVQHCYNRANIHFQPSVSLKHLTPQDIYATTHDHRKMELIREN